MQPSAPGVGAGVGAAAVGSGVGTIATGALVGAAVGFGGREGAVAIEKAGNVQPEASSAPTNRIATAPTSARKTRLRRRRFGSRITRRSCAPARAASASWRVVHHGTFELVASRRS